MRSGSHTSKNRAFHFFHISLGLSIPMRSAHRWAIMSERNRLRSKFLRNGPDKNDSNNGNEHVGIQLVCKKVITFLLSVFTSDWLKQKKLTKLHKSSIIFILTFQPSSFFHLVSVEMNSTEIVCGEHVKL